LEFNQYTNCINVILECVLICYFGMVFYYDFKFRKIYNVTIVIGIIIGMIYGIWINGWLNTAVGGGIGFVLMLIVYAIGIKLMPYIALRRGVYLHNKALYPNDILLGLISGLFLGRRSIISGLFFSSLFLAAVSLIYSSSKIIKKEYHPDLSLPISPFIIMGSIFVNYLPIIQGFVW